MWTHKQKLLRRGSEAILPHPHWGSFESRGLNRWRSLPWSLESVVRRFRPNTDFPPPFFSPKARHQKCPKEGSPRLFHYHCFIEERRTTAGWLSLWKYLGSVIVSTSNWLALPWPLLQEACPQRGCVSQVASNRSILLWKNTYQTTQSLSLRRKKSLGEDSSSAYILSIPCHRE